MICRNSPFPWGMQSVRMFLEYYGFREQPFGFTPNPRYLFPSESCREANASLLCAIESSVGFSALVAEPGMGKTTLLFSVLEKFRQNGRTAFVFTTQASPADLLRYINLEFELPDCGVDPVRFHEQFKEFLIAEAQEGRPVILLLDEAQNLDSTCLETIRILSDFEIPGQKLLHIVLAGQPQLARNLSHATLSQLLQRVAVITRLKRLNTDETSAYIEHHLRTAGYEGRPLFSAEAARWIAEKSEGIPRQINRICFNGLSIACALRKSAVGVVDLKEVEQDLELDSHYDCPPVDKQEVSGTPLVTSSPRSRVEYSRVNPPQRTTPGHSVTPLTTADPLLQDQKSSVRRRPPVNSFASVSASHQTVGSKLPLIKPPHIVPRMKAKSSPQLLTRAMKVAIAVVIVIEVATAILLMERHAPATLQIIDRVREEMQAIVSAPNTSQVQPELPHAGSTLRVSDGTWEGFALNPLLSCLP